MNVLSPAALAGLGGTVLSGAPAGRSPDSLALGVRAEAAHLVSDGIPAGVAAVEYLGADTLLDTRVGGEPFIVRLTGRPPVSAGATVLIA